MRRDDTHSYLYSFGDGTYNVPRMYECVYAISFLLTLVAFRVCESEFVEDCCCTVWRMERDKNGLPDCTLLYIKHHLNRYTFVHFLLFTADIDGEINATSLCVRTNSTKEIYQNAAHTLLPYIPHQLYTNALELFFVPRLKGSRANRSDAKVDWREVSASSPPGSDRYSARNAMEVLDGITLFSHASRGRYRIDTRPRSGLRWL